MTTKPDEPSVVREGRELLDFHFFPDDGEDRYGRAVEFRENVIRVILFDVHLAIDEMVRSFLYDFIAEHSVFDSDSDIGYVTDLSSSQLFNVSARLGIIDAELYGALADLNAVRNKAGHVWSLSEPVQRRSASSPERYPLTWRNKRLTPSVMRDELLPLYGDIYLAMFSDWIGAHPEQLGGGSDDEPPDP